jgi:hypothetical protein
MTVQERLKLDVEQGRNKQGDLIEPALPKHPEQHPQVMNTPTPQSNVPGAAATELSQEELTKAAYELLLTVHGKLEALQKLQRDQGRTFSEETANVSQRLAKSEAFSQATYEKLLEQQDMLHRRHDAQRRPPRGVSPIVLMGFSFLGGLAGALGFYCAWRVIESL